MDILLFLALVAFAAAAVVAAIQKSWVLALMCAGLTLLALAQTGLLDT
jgi:thiol:disulfide interchange protein